MTQNWINTPISKQKKVSQRKYNRSLEKNGMEAETIKYNSIIPKNMDMLKYV